MDRHIVDERIFDSRADGIPAGAIVLEPAQNYRIAADNPHGVVIELLLADGYDVADNVWVRVPPRPQRVGDDARSFAGCDEEKVVAEVLNRCVDICRVGKRAKAASDLRITAGSLRGGRNK